MNGQSSTSFATSWLAPQQSPVPQSSVQQYLAEQISKQQSPVVAPEVADPTSSAYQPPEVFEVANVAPMALPTVPEVSAPQSPASEQIAVVATEPAVVSPPQEPQQQTETEHPGEVEAGDPQTVGEPEPETAPVAPADDNVPAPEATEPPPVVAAAGPSIVIYGSDDSSDSDDDETTDSEDSEDDELELVPIPQYYASRKTEEDSEPVVSKETAAKTAADVHQTGTIEKGSSYSPLHSVMT